MEQIFFGNVPVTDADILHDSASELYRRPAGAVSCGTAISLALRTGGLCIEYAELCMLRDGTTERLCLADPDAEGLRRVSYTAPASPASRDAGQSGGIVLWYWFEIRLSGGALLYYGAVPPYGSGLGRVYPNPPPAFQITVYDADFVTPDWAKDAVLYQIFPDRFAMGDPDGVRAGVEYHRGLGREEIELHEDWGALPVYEAKEGRKYYMPCDIFGGDIEGIRQRLPYLQELGVTLLYLNPIFEAASNHRYNTGDYRKIDPILGDAETFRRLAAEAGELGIRVVLDGVFSHTGDDSVYFNKYGRYAGAGAYQSAESPYFGWYRFEDWPERYASWWGFESLPEVDEYDEGWREFVLGGEDCVIGHWIREGASGYRLDVADELPDETIAQIRTAVKRADPQAFLLGEVWEDATTKQSYGRPRAYALGRGLDSVMNYPFLSRTIEFLQEKTDARFYQRFLSHQRDNYPAPMYYTLMNLLSSHDVSRVRSMLARDFDPAGMSRPEQAYFELSEEEYALGGLRQRLAAAIQYALPGIPSVYYGDEVGMTGLLDPFNRRTWREQDAAIREWYLRLGRLRREMPVLRTGHVSFFSTDGDVLGILRYAADGRDCFGKEIGRDAALTVVNPKQEPRRIVFDLGAVYESLPPDAEDAVLRGGEWEAAGLLGGGALPLLKGLLEIDMPAVSAEIFLLTRT